MRPFKSVVPSQSVASSANSNVLITSSGFGFRPINTFRQGTSGEVPRNDFGTYPAYHYL